MAALAPRSLRARRRIAVLVGGGLGAGARVATAALIPGTLLATFGVNILGTYALGYLLPRLRLAGRSRAVSLPLLGIGFLGAFTTFSSFAVEAVSRPPLLAFAYVAGSLAAGVVVGAVGLRHGRRR